MGELSVCWSSWLEPVKPVVLFWTRVQVLCLQARGLQLFFGKELKFQLLPKPECSVMAQTTRKIHDNYNHLPEEQLDVCHLAFATARSFLSSEKWHPLETMHAPEMMISWSHRVWASCICWWARMSRRRPWRHHGYGATRSRRASGSWSPVSRAQSWPLWMLSTLAAAWWSYIHSFTFVSNWKADFSYISRWIQSLLHCEL